MTGQIRIKGGKRQQVEQILHVCIVQFEDGQSDRPHTRSNQLFFGVVQGQGRLEQWKSLQSVIEEKVYGLIVQAKN